jgi:aryl carrier-like protein
MAIDSKELRIGNWVSEEILGKAMVHDISPNHCSLSVKHMDVDRVISDVNYSITLINIKPIPLTPEILLDCGLEKYRMSSCTWYWRSGNRKFNFRELADGRFNMKFQYNFLPITNLHQLQNIYFALTGKELEYNPQTIKQ